MPLTGVAALETKYQEVPGTTDEKIPYALQDLEALWIPGCLVYAGSGWSKGVLHTLEGSRRAVHCLHERPDLARTFATRELDHVLAAVFGLWDRVIPEDDVRAMIIQLERRRREHGLIPQTGKFAVKRAASVTEAMGSLPSIADPHRSSGPSRPPLAKERARSLFLSSLCGRPYRVQDKTRLRYALYRAEPDAQILRRVAKLVPHHPEHADVFFTYLRRFDARRSIVELCVDTIRRSAYAYVRGEAWLVLAEHLSVATAMSRARRKSLIGRAVALAKKRRPMNFFETLAACHFLAVAETLEDKH